jgi:hypothetical protein
MLSKTITITVILLFVFTALGCTTKVYLNPDNYKPNIVLNQNKRFLNKKIYMRYFINSAQNTSRYAYYSPDEKIRYETNQTLDSYFWQCFRYAFDEISVAASPYEYGMIEFNYELVSLTDQFFRFNVNLTKNRSTIFQKMYSVAMTPPEGTSVTSLEARAYKLVDKSFETIINDPAFLANFDD